MVETPTDEVDVPKPKRKPNPNLANRYKCFDDGGGNYRIYEIAGGDQGLPKGSLTPIAGMPAFETTASAEKFVRDSGDLLNGKQFLILKGVRIGSMNVQTITKTQVTWKPRLPAGGPAAKESGGQ
jgi:hypothetical protein